MSDVIEKEGLLINSQTVRTVIYRLGAGANDAELEGVVACLDELRERLENEEDENEDFESVTSAEFGYFRSQIAVVRREGDHFAVDFDYDGNGNYSAWATYREARDEAERLWRHGYAGELVDFVAKRADEQRAEAI